MLPHFLQRGIFTVRWKAARLVLRLLPLASTKVNLGGVRVYLSLVDKGEIDEAREQVAWGLALILHYDPRRFARLRADLRGIQVYQFAVRKAAHYDLGYCVLSPSLVFGRNKIHIACTIVHEATHARLHRRKVRYDTPAKRVRVERRCVAEEIAFVEKIPGTQAYLEWLQSTVAEIKPEEYTNEAMWTSEFQDSLESKAAWKKSWKTRPDVGADPKAG